MEALPGATVRGYSLPVNYVLGIILAFLCALIGVLAIGWIGYELLWLFGMRGYSRRRMQVAGWAFALPAGIAGAWIGYLLWTQLQFGA